MSKKDKELRPFFANFLEGIDEEDQDQLIAGGPPTRKYPSDREEIFAADFDTSTSDKRVTYKYPSDKDEIWGIEDI